MATTDTDERSDPRPRGRPKGSGEEKTVLCVRLPSGLTRRLKEEAEKQERAQSTITARALRAYFDGLDRVAASTVSSGRSSRTAR